ncbi:hypothetical protein [Tenacibaculum sp.]|uniref:hypothetical protein n=1 Tax=Tenacibaculum sp. TaxID=1906242 RepID=UPI003AA977FB
MRFILSEYITLLKEDGELDTLITDLLVGMKITPISKPQRGRQHGVDIAAVGIDPIDNKRKVFLIAVKQKNLTRSSWDSEVNSVRPSLNEIIDVYIPTLLDKRYKKLPIKIIVATNGEMVQNVQTNWKNYVDKHTKKKRTYEFWGTGELANMLDIYLDNEKLFPSKYQSLLRKTLAFLDLSDYDYSHFYILLDQILSKPEKQKQRVLKKLRLIRLCTGIIFKWSQDIDNLKPSLIASERALLVTWNWIEENNLFERNYVKIEFYNLHLLKRKLGVFYFNKVANHYKTKHSLSKYSKNYLEYSLNSWNELGLLATVGLTEIQELVFKASTNQNEEAKLHYTSALSISNALEIFIFNTPPLNYPQYDEHSIEIALSLQLLWKTGKTEVIRKWISNMVVAFHNNFHLYKFFPLFRTNFDKLVDIHNGNEIHEPESSMILTIILEYVVLLDNAELYQKIRSLIHGQFPKINLQMWFATEEIENVFCSKNYSAREGRLKHSIVVYENMEDYRKEIIEEIDLFLKEDKFEFYTSGFHLMGHLASRHFRAQPFPVFWRLPIKKLKETQKL